MTVLLIVSPNFSLAMLKEEIGILAGGERDFTRSVDWRPAAPLGVLYIAGALRRAGHCVVIHDTHRAFFRCREDGYFRDRTLDDFLRDHVEAPVRAAVPEVIGFASLFNVSSDSVREMALRCKRLFPAVPVVMGGHYPSNCPDEVLAAGGCDYVIRGEAEEAFVWLCDTLTRPDADGKISRYPHICSHKMPGGKTPAVIEDLDTLAEPAWDLLAHAGEYIGGSIDADRVGSLSGARAVRAASIFTTRGCPMRCAFCAAHGVHGRRVREHSIPYLMRHIDRLIEQFDINDLLIQDDMFNHSIDRAVAFCDALSERYGRRFSLEFPNGLAVWNVDKRLIASLQRAGLTSVTVAVESGSAYVQRHILRKGLDLALVRRNIALFRDAGLGVRAFFVIGMVGETPAMMEETVRFALELDLDWAEIKIFTPLIGSDMYVEARDKGYLVGDMSEHVYGRSCVSTPDFTPERVKDIQYDANIRINFLHNRFLRTGEYARAERLFRGLTERFPGHVFALWGLCRALEGAGRTAEAAQVRAEIRSRAAASERVRALLKRYEINEAMEG